MILFYISKLFKKVFRMSSVRNCYLAKTAKIGDACNILNSYIDQYSYIGDHTIVAKTNIGKFTSIAPYCIIGGGAHPTEWVSMSPVFNNTRCIIKEKFGSKEFNPHQTTNIGNDVWIGANALIKSGVTIADGAVIGAGSMVTKNVGPYEIWAGNPARLIRKRFDNETIDKLLKLQWWDWEKDKIIQYADTFDSPKEFINSVENKEYEKT